MKLHVVMRKLHYWVSIGIALPALLVIASGLLLQVKKDWHWVQPAEHRGTGTSPQVSLDTLLGNLLALPDSGVRSWDDIDRVDVRIGKGMAKVRLQNGTEVQMDMGTGAVLQHVPRHTDLIESIHDGSLFGGRWVKLGLFLPSAILLLFLLVSGLILFFVPQLATRRRKRLLEPWADGR